MSEPTTLDLITLVIAILGLVASVVALVWQVLSWRMSGSRVKVEGRHAVIVPDDEGIHVLAVNAHNIGRIQVSVTGWGFSYPNKTHIPGHAYQPMAWINPKVPHTLEPGHSASWHLPIDVVKKAALDQGYDLPVSVVPLVHLGTGKQNTGKSLNLDS